MICAPLPEPPHVSLHTPHHLIFVGKVCLPQQRAVAEHPYRLRCFTGWTRNASAGGRFSRTALLGWILFRRMAACHRLFLFFWRGSIVLAFINIPHKAALVPSLCDTEWNLRIGPQFHVVYAVLMAPAGDPGHSSCCVECGKGSNQALYKEFSGGTIQLSQCVSFAVVLNWLYTCPSPLLPFNPLPPTHAQVHCHKVLDKYVEFDAVILLLDVLLLRIQSFRHLIFNYGISFSVSLASWYSETPGSFHFCCPSLASFPASPHTFLYCKWWKAGWGLWRGWSRSIFLDPTSNCLYSVLQWSYKFLSAKVIDMLWGVHNAIKSCFTYSKLNSSAHVWCLTENFFLFCFAKSM